MKSRLLEIFDPLNLGLDFFNDLSYNIIVEEEVQIKYDYKLL